MFYPRYNFSQGRIRPAGRRVAAVGQSNRRRSGVRKAFTSDGGMGGLQGAGGGMMQPYSPVYERAEDPTLAEEFMPTDTQTQNKIFRNIIMYDPIAGPATEYWRDMAFSRHVRLGGLEDDKILRFYEDAIEASGVEAKMPWLLNDYLVFGRVTALFDMGKKGYWKDIIIHDPDFVEVVIPPFSAADPIVNVQSTNEVRDWAVSRDPRIMEQRAEYDPEIIKLMALGEAYPLPAEHTLFMARQAYATDYFGTSYLTRIIPFKIMEKALIDAEIQAARRRAGPVWVISVPENYEAEEIQEIIDQFFAVEEDAIGGKVAVRGDVTVTPIGGGKADFWTLSDEYDFLKNAKMNALGISESFLCISGDTYIATQEHGIVQLDELQEEDATEQDLVLTVAGRHGPAQTSKWRYSGYADTLQVTTKQGYSIQATPEHQVLMLSGTGDLEWRRANQLTPGDLLCVNTKACTRETPLPLNIPEYVLRANAKIPTKPEFMTPELAFVLGLLVSEGCHNRGCVEMTNSDQALIDYYRTLVQQLFGLETAIYRKVAAGTEIAICGTSTCTTKDCYAICISSRILSKWLTYLGLIPGGSAHNKPKQPSWYKDVPWCILQADKESQLAYLAAYIEGDGYIAHNRGSTIDIFSRSETNLKQLQVLLAAHGITSKHMVEYHRLTITTVQARKLHVLIAPYMISKRPLDEHLVECRPNAGCVNAYAPFTFVVAMLKERFVRQEHKGTWFLNDAGEEVFIHRGGTLVMPHVHEERKRLLYSTYRAGKYDALLDALRLISASATTKLERLLKEEHFFDAVQEISDAGKAHVYDISMAEGEEPAFVANGLVVHNSGEASYNSMEKILHVFVEKLRAMRAHFTEQVIITKMLKNLARMHGYTQTKQAYVAHHYRIAKKEINDADLLIPTVEWDRPLEPQADLDYWDLLERLETKNIPIHRRKWAQAAGYDLDETIDNAQTELEDRAKLYQIKAALAKQAEEAGFTLEGEFLGEQGAIGGGLGGGPPGGGGLDFGGGPPGGEPGGEALDLGPGTEFELAPALETPPATPELPAPEAPAPAGGAGAGAPEHARFDVKQTPQFARYANPQYQDLEEALQTIAVWGQDGSTFDMPIRRVAQLVDKIAHRDPRDREARKLTRFLTKEGLNHVQSGIVQYCAARLGFLPQPHIDHTTVEHLQRMLVDRAQRGGINQRLNQEFEILARITGVRNRTPVAGYRNLTSRDQLPDHQILTGIV